MHAKFAIHVLVTATSAIRATLTDNIVNINATLNVLIERVIIPRESAPLVLLDGGGRFVTFLATTSVPQVDAIVKVDDAWNVQVKHGTANYATMNAVSIVPTTNVSEMGIAHWVVKAITLVKIA